MVADEVETRESDIVPRANIVFAGIAETDDEMHRDNVRRSYNENRTGESKNLLKKSAFPEKIIFLLVLHFVRKPQKTIFSGKARSIPFGLDLLTGPEELLFC